MKYRQTVARTGSPPTGWTKPKLSDCVHMKSGDMITAKKIFEVEAYPVYGGNGLRGFTDRFNREGAHSLIGRQGALCGAVHFADGQFYASEHAIVAKALGKNDQRFLTYVLDALNLNEVSEASAQPGLSVEKLRSIEILCPTSPDEQQAIAAALSDADGVVAGLERVIAKKRLIKQGAMQDLLTARRRLPGFSGEWSTVQLKDYTSHGAGNSSLIKGTLQRSGRVGSYPAFTASGPDLMLDFFEQEGDAIIISAVGSRCGKSFRAKGKWSAIANTHVLRCREGLDVDFAFIFMNDEDFWLKGGTGQPFVLVRRTLERPLLLPPLNEQQAIAAVLSDMDAEIQTLESRLAKARAVKEGMMQNLLTGRVRLV